MSHSSQPQSLSVGATLTGGIQDVSAILPLIGTEQCETHVGSALAGGYLYAASSVLSIFGSLGIVKCGFSVLAACVTFRKPWVSDHDGTFEQSMVFGGKFLQNSAFGLKGDVAPLIGLEGTRFKAETKLVQMMEEKHIDNPEKVSIRWKSKDWNIKLILFTMVAAVISGIPYFALLGKASWRPSAHVPWTFPILRTVGSCFASVLCQFMIQKRVVSLMKHRIMFMDIHQQLSDIYSTDNKDGLGDWIEKHNLQWDPNLPAEECIANFERFLASSASATQTNDDPKEGKSHVAIEMENIATSSTSPPPPSHPVRRVFSAFIPSPRAPPPPIIADVKFDVNILQGLRQRHFPSPTSDRAVMLISWAVLLLSLPSVVAGYVGCFTLVSSSKGNGPLVWLGLEAALSIIRISIWAWNPKFDEDTGITMELELTGHPPMVTTVEHNAFIHDSDDKNTKPLVLVREREFLEWITPYTGPLNQFANPVNVALYFTLTADYSASAIKEDLGRKCTSLLLTIFDFNTRVGVTILKIKEAFYFFDADVKYATIYNEISANLQLPMMNNHSWRIHDSGLFSSLEDHYNYVVEALNGRANKEPTENIAGPEQWWKCFWKSTRQVIEMKNISTLDRRWDLFPKATPSRKSTSWLSLPDLTNHDQLYLDRGFEHHLKTKLVGVWSRWITENMKTRASAAWSDCYEALTDETSEKAKWELTELDWLVELEWANRELALLTLSLRLEENLRLKMEKCIRTVCEEWNDGRLERWMRSEFDVGRRKRLDRERGEAKKRMEQAMRDREERAEREGRPWRDQGHFAPKWQDGIEFVDKRWSEGIRGGPEALRNEECRFNDLGRLPSHFIYNQDKRMIFVAEVDERFTRWKSQRENERQEMDAAFDRICRVGDQREQMDIAYDYPEPDKEAASKFVNLRYSSSKGRACSAMVYNVWRCSAEVVCNVIKKSTTRSVIDVDPDIVASIPPNDHLLFLSCFPNGKEPAFVQDNQDRWWQQQTTNSALFYLTPHRTRSYNSCGVPSGPIAQILVFLANAAPSRIRLRLLHCSYKDVSVAIQHKDETLHTLAANELPKTLKMQSLELKELPVGRHELQVVAVPGPDKYCYYHLRDILIEFFTDNPIPVSAPANDASENGLAIGDEYLAEETSSSSHDQSPLLPPNAQDSESHILSGSDFEFKTGVQ